MRERCVHPPTRATPGLSRDASSPHLPCGPEAATHTRSTPISIPPATLPARIGQASFATPDRAGRRRGAMALRRRAARRNGVSGPAHGGSRRHPARPPRGPRRLPGATGADSRGRATGHLAMPGHRCSTRRIAPDARTRIRPPRRPPPRGRRGPVPRAGGHPRSLGAGSWGGHRGAARSRRPRPATPHRTPGRPPPPPRRPGPDHLHQRHDGAPQGCPHHPPQPHGPDHRAHHRLGVARGRPHPSHAAAAPHPRRRERPGLRPLVRRRLRIRLGGAGLHLGPPRVRRHHALHVRAHRLRTS